MATVNGTTSRRTANYDFYFVWTLTKDTANKRHAVNVKAYLKCVSWDFETAVSQSWAHINIGGTVYNRPSGGINCNQYPTPHTYLLWEKTVYYAYSNQARSVYLRAYTDDLYVAGHGPGVCNAATTISIPAAYATSGSMTGTAESEAAVNLALAGLPSNVGYARTIKWYYKRTIDSVWALYSEDSEATTISATSTATTVSKRIGKLLPSTAYSFQAKIYDGTTLLSTISGSATTMAMMGSAFCKYGVNTAVVTATGLNPSVGYDRIAKGYYKKSADSEYTYFTEKTIVSGDSVVLLTFSGLMSATAYDFKIEYYRGTVLLGSKTVLNITTLEPTSTIPEATLVKAVNIPLTTTIRVYWYCHDCPTGSSFKVCHQPSGGSIVIGNEITTPPASGYTDIDVGAIAQNTEYAVSVRSYKTGAAGYKSTEIVDVTVFITFDWDEPKVQGGAFNLTADEWNRMLEFIQFKFPGQITKAIYAWLWAAEGRGVDNERFNIIQNAAGITDNDKDDGDAIEAADLNAIKAAINA